MASATEDEPVLLGVSPEELPDRFKAIQRAFETRQRDLLRASKRLDFVHPDGVVRPLEIDGALCYLDDPVHPRHANSLRSTGLLMFAVGLCVSANELWSFHRHTENFPDSTRPIGSSVYVGFVISLVGLSLVALWRRAAARAPPHVSKVGTWLLRDAFLRVEKDRATVVAKSRITEVVYRRTVDFSTGAVETWLLFRNTDGRVWHTLVGPRERGQATLKWFQDGRLDAPADDAPEPRTTDEGPGPGGGY